MKTNYIRSPVFIKPFPFLPGHQSAPSEHPDPGDPRLPGERAGGEGPEEALQPGAEESAAGRVPAGESRQDPTPCCSRVRLIRAQCDRRCSGGVTGNAGRNVSCWSAVAGAAVLLY